MLGLAKRLRARILQASTSEVYGDPSVQPQAEDYWGHLNPIGPRSCYDEGKRCAENLVLWLVAPTSTTHQGGADFNASQTRSFCYIDDLIDGLVRFMATRVEVTGPVNIGDPSEFSVLELATIVIDLTGSRSRIVPRPRREDDPEQRRPDISRAQELLDWKLRTLFKDGLVRTIAYFDELLSDQKLRAQLIAEPQLEQNYNLSVDSWASS